MQNFDSIYTENYPKVLSWIKYKINNQEQAEELASDIFLKIHNNLNKFDEKKSSMKTWVMNITKNAIIDFFRTNKSSLNISLSDMVDDEGHETFVHTDFQNPETLMQNNQLGIAMQRAIAELPSNQSTIATMFMIDELSHEEISADLNVPIGTVKATIHRAKENLRNRLLNYR